MRLISGVLMAILLAFPVRSEGEKAADFDYYVLSWSAGWCAATGDARGDPQCDAGGLTFVPHGLWPQDEAAIHNTAAPVRPIRRAVGGSQINDGGGTGKRKTHGIEGKVEKKACRFNARPRIGLGNQPGNDWTGKPRSRLKLV